MTRTLFGFCGMADKTEISCQILRGGISEACAGVAVGHRVATRKERAIRSTGDSESIQVPSADPVR